MGNIVDTVGDMIQNAILTVSDNITTPRNELAVRSKIESIGQNATSVAANWKHEERMRTTAPFENVTEGKNILHDLSVNVETRRNFPDEINELSVPHFEAQSQTHHMLTG